MKLECNNVYLTRSARCPEGDRIGVLVNYAEGCDHLAIFLGKNSKLLEASVADIHEKTKNFRTKHKRKILDLTYLVDKYWCKLVTKRIAIKQRVDT